MTNEDREACSYLFNAFTKETIPPHKWNDKAVVELYIMVKKLKDCSMGMSFITSLPVLFPKTGPSAAMAAIKYIRQIWIASREIDKNKINPRCEESHSRGHANIIKAAAWGL